MTINVMFHAGKTLSEQVSSLVNEKSSSEDMLCVFRSLLKYLNWIAPSSDITPEAFIDFWKVISDMKVVTTKEILAIEVNGQNLTLTDIQNWNEDRCYLPRSCFKSVLKAMLEISIAKIEN